MLTSVCWVPNGGMRTVPLRSSDDAEEAKRQLRGDSDSDVAEHALSDDETKDAVYNQGAGNLVDGVETDDESEVNDTTFKSTDQVFVTARADEDPRFELFVYDNTTNNMYVHHDAPIAAYPLDLTWLSEGTTSMLAVGTMLPFIEIWNLDVIDPVSPIVVLGGCEKPERNYKRRIRPEWLTPSSHTDAVISVEWNTAAQQIVASGGADGKLKLWDLNQVSNMGTYDEEHKVQSLAWHETEANLLLSGVSDVVSIRDCRQPNVAATRWSRGGDMIEKVKWGHNNTIISSTTNGNIVAYEARHGGSPLWEINVHESETVFDISRHGPFLAAGGKDGETSLWRVDGESPVRLASRQLGVGQTFSIQFHPNDPTIFSAVGTKGKPLVYSITQDTAQ